MTNDRPTPEPLLYQVSDLCRLLSISRSSFFSLRSAGRIPLQPVRLNSKLLFRSAEVTDWVREGCPAAGRWDWTSQQKGQCR
jgi:predicted DNA-binding transcriptional regulator AlpA